MEKDDAIELWHRSLGHMGEKGMTQLARRNILSGIDKVHLKNSVDCLAGKQSRVAFRSSLPSRVENVRFDSLRFVRTNAKVTWWCSLLGDIHR